MSLQTGLYKVVFKTALGEGAGVVVLENGKVRGGDSGFSYIGTYEEKTGGFTAIVAVSRHTATASLASVFGVEVAQVNLSGHATGESFSVEGSSASAPGLSFQAHLQRLTD